MIGTVLSNRYKLISELGHGGMAWVYLAEDLRQDRQVAVKVLYPQLGQDLGFLQRFSQEAKLAMALSRSAPEIHIARVLDYGSDQDTQYLVMEYVAGHDLRRALAEHGPLAWETALDIARQVALGLGHAYQHGIVHRDVKPENIMVLPDDTVRVLDFGVARARTSPSLTHSGFVGSPYYVSPEQAMGRRVDIRADLYSLGVVLYEMLTGGRPFQSDTPWAIINQHIASPPPLIEEALPELPKSVARLVRKAMAKRPEDRFQTPAEMVQAIEAVLAGEELPAESTTTEREVLAPLLAGLYERAQQAATEQDWREAVDLYSQILRFDPRYQDVSEQLAEAGRQARLAALYEAAQKAIKAENWSDALAQLDEIARVAPSYRDVKEMHVTARTGQELELASRAEETGHEEPAAVDPVETPTAKDSRPAHRRNLLWAIIGILLVALALEIYMFYNTQQPPAIAAVSAPVTLTSTAIPPVTATLPLPSPIAIPAVASTEPLPSADPSATRLSATTTTEPTPRLLPSNTATRQPTRTAAATRTPTLAASQQPTPSNTPSVTATATTTLTPTVEPPPTGRIAFPRFDPSRGTYDVYVCRVDGANCKRIATEASQPDFLPGGVQLVVHSWKPDDKGLFLLSLSGQRIWQITNLIEAARPSVDYQGRHYVYHTRLEEDRQPRLYRTYGSEIQPIEREANLVFGTSPSWLPDGRILYSGCLADACGILVTASNGSQPRQVAAGGSEANPEASPNGRQVAFMSQRDGNWEVYAVDLDGSHLRRLTRNPANDGLPTWSPDGRYLAFVSDRDGRWAMWIMRPDGSGQRKLFDLGGPLDGQVLGAAAHEAHGWAEERISWAP